MSRMHLYEFRADTRLLKCNCGWEHTLKSASPKLVTAAFESHRRKLG